jgi:hypothetical protein
VYDHTRIASYRHLRSGKVGGEYGYWLLKGNECCSAGGFPSNSILSGSAPNTNSKNSIKKHLGHLLCIGATEVRHDKITKWLLNIPFQKQRLLRYYMYMKVYSMPIPYFPWGWGLHVNFSYLVNIIRIKRLQLVLR